MKKVITLLLFFLLPAGMFSQLVSITDHYLLCPMAINPAYAGSRSALSMSLLYRTQWTGMNGAPETGLFSIDAPILNEKLGLGLMVVADNIGVTREEQVMTNYAYRIGLGDGILSMGLGANLVITNSAWSDLVTNDDVGDASFLVDSRTYLMPNFRFGIFYSIKKYFAGFSIPRFLSYSYDLDNSKYALQSNVQQYNYLLHTGNTFDLNNKLSLTPSVLVGYMSSEGFSFDVNAQVGYMEKVWLGVSYRSNKTILALFKMQLSNQFAVGYCFNYDLGQLGKYNNGSHLVMLRYEFKYKVDVTNPLLF